MIETNKMNYITYMYVNIRTFDVLLIYQTKHSLADTKMCHQSKNLEVVHRVQRRE